MMEKVKAPNGTYIVIRRDDEYVTLKFDEEPAEEQINAALMEYDAQKQTNVNDTVVEVEAEDGTII